MTARARAPREALEAGDAERGVLGSILIDYEAIFKVTTLLRSDDFYHLAHGQIYAAALALLANATPIDLVTLGDELESRGELNAVGGPAFLASLINAVPTAAHVVHYASIVRARALARRMVDAGGRLAAAGREHPNDPDSALAALDDITIALRASWPILTTGNLWERLGARLLSVVSTDPPPPLLIDRLDPVGHTILYGAGGSGKGVLASDWVVSLRSCGHRVLIADYENHPDEWARRIYGLGGSELMNGIVVVAPLTAAWGGRRGPLWDQADDLRALAAATESTYLLIDSIVPACAGTDPLKPDAAALYAGALEYIGLPTLSLAHVPKDGDLRYPFGSVFWHNLARLTHSLERMGASSLLTNRKANNYVRRPKHAVETTWLDGRPTSVWEKPYLQLLNQRISAALANGSLTVAQLVDHLNDENDDEDAPSLKTDSVRKALLRGARARPPLFVKEGDKWSVA